MDFEVACNAVKVKDDDLKLLILEDFLKITIAEKYFSERKTFDEIAKELNVDKDIIIRTYNIMLDDIMNTQKNKLDLGKPEDLGINPPKGNA